MTWGLQLRNLEPLHIKIQCTCGQSSRLYASDILAFEKCHLFFSGRIHFLDIDSSFGELSSLIYFHNCRMEIVCDHCTLHRNDSNFCHVYLSIFAMFPVAIGWLGLTGSSFAIL